MQQYLQTFTGVQKITQNNITKTAQILLTGSLNEQTKMDAKLSSLWGTGTIQDTPLTYPP